MMIRWCMILACCVLLLPLAGCMTPLTSAAQAGDTKTVLSELEHGADINDVIGDGYKPIHLAAWEGHVETVRALLDRGADVNSRGERFMAGYTPLHFAAIYNHPEVARLLIERGADVTLTNRDSHTALYYADKRGSKEIADMIRQVLANRAPPPTAPRPMAEGAPVTPAPAAAVLPLSDVDHLPAGKRPTKQNAYAVVIGIESYREKLPKADFADRDARLMGEYLTKVLGYPEENVVVRLNDKATGNDLVKYFDEWLRNNVEAGGSVFIYYSGHGAPNTKTGDAYLVPYDGDPTFVESTGYPVKRLYAALEKLPAKDITVVLDSCFSGAGGRSVIAKGMRPMVISVENPLVTSGKTVVLSASAGDQVSSTYEEKDHGLLTYFFLKGLQGEGDLNKDGTIEMTELFEYVKPNVQRVARKQYNNEQTPQLLASPELLRKGGGRLVELR